MEIWRPVVGFEGGYMISDAGHVRSVTRIVVNSEGISKTIHGKNRKIVMSNRNRACLVLRRDGKSHMRQVHHMVLEAFVGGKPDGLWGLHRDDDPTNNRLDNLYWGTPSENTADCIRNGKHSMASKTTCIRGHEFTEENTKVTERATGHTKRECLTCLELHNSTRREANAQKDPWIRITSAKAKLTAEQVREIRSTHISGHRGNGHELAARYDVSKDTINKVANGSLYQWVL